MYSIRLLTLTQPSGARNLKWSVIETWSELPSRAARIATTPSFMVVVIAVARSSPGARYDGCSRSAADNRLAVKPDRADFACWAAASAVMTRDLRLVVMASRTAWSWRNAAWTSTSGVAVAPAGRSILTPPPAATWTDTGAGAIAGCWLARIRSGVSMTVLSGSLATVGGVPASDRLEKRRKLIARR